MPRSQKPNRRIFGVLVFAAVYPLVTGLAYLMQITAEGWAIRQRHPVGVPTIVVAMVFVIISRIQRLLVHPNPLGRSPDPVAGPTTADASMSCPPHRIGGGMVPAFHRRPKHTFRDDLRNVASRSIHTA